MVKKLTGSKLAILLLCIPLLAGCAALIGAAGMGSALGYRYVKGELKVVYQSDFVKVWNAIQHAIKDLELKVIKEQADKVEGIIVARTALGKKVKIKASYNGKITKVKIRVGTLGNLDYSLAIKYRIDSYLLNNLSTNPY